METKDVKVLCSACRRFAVDVHKQEYLCAEHYRERAEKESENVLRQEGFTAEELARMYFARLRSRYESAFAREETKRYWWQDF